MYVNMSLHLLYVDNSESNLENNDIFCDKYSTEYTFQTWRHQSETDTIFPSHSPGIYVCMNVCVCMYLDVAIA
jgi:hypothetical protein